MRTTLAMLALALAIAGPATATPIDGVVRFFQVANSAFDGFTRAATPASCGWMRSRYARMLVYAPYFDSRLGCFGDAWVYKDLYAIYPGSPLAAAHPEWILRDASGHQLFIPYGCGGGTCPQLAADVGSPAFRAQWIAEAKATLGKGYRGLFVDDVNMLVSRVSDGNGRPVPPVDPRTGRAMTEGDWRRALADFTAQIRAAFPATELVHNALWFAGREDPDVVRQLDSASVVNLERGVNDDGLRGGSGEYGFDTFLAYVDWLHARGKTVIFDGGARTKAEREYGLAAYLLVSAGGDYLGNDRGGRPDDWWPAYEVSLGASLGPRHAWNGLLRRDFEGGMVLVNPPDAARRTVDLAREWRDLDGRPRANVTLEAAEGMVLRKAVPGVG
jgi:hypothetical protein